MINIRWKVRGKSDITSKGQYKFFREFFPDWKIRGGRLLTTHVWYRGQGEEMGANFESLESSLPKMIFSCASCTISILVSNLSCLALSSYFFSILPTKRNLLTYFNIVLVLSITAVVNVTVGGVIILGNLKLDSQKLPWE